MHFLLGFRMSQSWLLAFFSELSFQVDWLNLLTVWIMLFDSAYGWSHEP